MWFEFKLMIISVVFFVVGLLLVAFKEDGLIEERYSVIGKKLAAFSLAIFLISLTILILIRI